MAHQRQMEVKKHSQQTNQKPETADQEDTADCGTAITCPECSGEVAIETGHAYEERYCTDCGIVVDQTTLDRGPEWRSFDSGESSGKTRGVGSLDTLKHDNGLGSTVGYSPDESPDLSRKREWNKQARMGQKRDRGYAKAITEIRTVTSQLGLGRSITERAVHLFREAQTNDVYGEGNIRERFVGAAIYAACRDYERVILIEDIVDHISLTESDDSQSTKTPADKIRRTYSTLCRELGLTPKIPRASDYVPQFMSDLDRPALTSHAVRIAEYAEDQQWSVGSDPTVVAAGVIYFTSQQYDADPLIQDEIADAANTTRPSIRDVYQSLLNEDDAPVTQSPRDGRSNEVSDTTTPNQLTTSTGMNGEQKTLSAAFGGGSD